MGKSWLNKEEDDETESNADDDEFTSIALGLKQALELVRGLPPRKHNERT